MASATSSGLSWTTIWLASMILSLATIFGLQTIAAVLSSPEVALGSPHIRNPTGTCTSAKLSHPSPKLVGSAKQHDSAHAGVASCTPPSGWGTRPWASQESNTSGCHEA